MSGLRRLVATGVVVGLGRAVRLGRGPSQLGSCLDSADCDRRRLDVRSVQRGDHQLAPAAIDEPCAAGERRQADQSGQHEQRRP